MQTPKSPCLNCPDRKVGCHIVCDKYIKYSKVCEEVRKEKMRIAEEYRIQKEIQDRRVRMAMTGKFYRSKRSKK